MSKIFLASAYNNVHRLMPAYEERTRRMPSVPLTYSCVYERMIIRWHNVGLISKPRMDTCSNFTGETIYCLNNSVFVKKLNNVNQTYKSISFNSSNVAFYIFCVFNVKMNILRNIRHFVNGFSIF